MTMSNRANFLYFQFKCLNNEWMNNHVELNQLSLFFHFKYSISVEDCWCSSSAADCCCSSITAISCCSSAADWQNIVQQNNGAWPKWQWLYSAADCFWSSCAADYCCISRSAEAAAVEQQNATATAAEVQISASAGVKQTSAAADW